MEVLLAAGLILWVMVHRAHERRVCTQLPRAPDLSGFPARAGRFQRWPPTSGEAAAGSYACHVAIYAGGGYL
jgi:hypothetical protein